MMRPLGYRYRKLTTLSMLVVGLFCVTMFTRAASVDDLKNQIQNREQEIKKLEEEIRTYQGALEKQSGVSVTLKGEIARIEQQIKKLNADIRLTQTKIERTELSIQDLSSKIRTTQEQIKRDQESLSELLRSAREAGDDSLIEVLLANGSVASMLDGLQSYDAVNNSIQDRLSSVRTHKEALEGDLSTRQKEEKALVNLKDALSGQKSANESVKSGQSKLLKDSKNQEVQYQKILKERERKRSLIQQELQDIETKLKQLIDPNSIPKKGSGVLGWPVADPLVTQQFGFTEFATTYGSDVYNGKGHNGIDLRASVGTRILSAANGTVKNTGDTDTLCHGGSYGKWIVIEHENGLSTLYAHLSSISVSAGQKVERGDRIGISGSTGYITGPHLHFTVYATNTYRLYQTKNCGKIPAGGYLNPADYL